MFKWFVFLLVLHLGAAVRGPLIDDDLAEKMKVLAQDVRLHADMLRVATKEVDFQKQCQIISADVFFKKHVLEVAQKEYDVAVAEQKKALQGNAVNGQEQENAKVLGFKKVLESAQSRYDNAVVDAQRSAERSAEEKGRKETLGGRFDEFVRSRGVALPPYVGCLSEGKITQTQKTVLTSFMILGVCDAEQKVALARKALKCARERYDDVSKNPEKFQEYNDQIRISYEEKTRHVLKWVLCGDADCLPGSAAALAQDFIRLHWKNQDLFSDVGDSRISIWHNMKLFMEGFLSEMDESTRRNICRVGEEVAQGRLELSLEQNNSLEGSAVALIYAVLVNSGSGLSFLGDLAKLYKLLVEPRIPSPLPRHCAKIYTSGQNAARYLAELPVFQS